MYQIHGLTISSNTTKTVYVAEELGIDYIYTPLDFSKGENKTPEHLARHPLGKLPTLTHDDKVLFESGAICRYLASVENSALYPINDHFTRCKIEQWMDFFTMHLGRWLNSYAFETVAKEKYGLGTPNEAVAEEALGFIEQQMPVVEDQLKKGKYLLGDEISIADLFAFAYVENAELAQVSLEKYPALKTWYQNMKARDSIQRAHKKLYHS